MPGNLFRLELASAFANRRRMVLRIGVSFLLAMPFIFVGMPARAQAAGIVMVILFTGFFGAAVGHARLRFDLRFARLTLLPMSRWVLWLDLALASTLARLAPAAVVLAVFVIVNGRGVTAACMIGLAGLLCTSLFLLTLLGMATGRLARSNGEVHLFGALVCAVLAFVSGVAPVPERLAWLSTTVPFNPIARLLAMLIRLAADPANAPRGELAFALSGLTAIVAMVVLRWISGGMRTTKGLDASNVGTDNRGTLRKKQNDHRQYQ